MAKKAVKKPAKSAGELYSIRIPPEQRANWQAAADAEELPLATWIKRHCNLAAKASKKP